MKDKHTTQTKKRPYSDALIRLWPSTHSTCDRPRRNNQINGAAPKIPQRYWGHVVCCVEMPSGCYVDKTGVPRPLDKRSGKIVVEDHPEDRDDDSQDEDYEETETDEEESDQEEKNGNKDRKQEIEKETEDSPPIHNGPDNQEDNQNEPQVIKHDTKDETQCINGDEMHKQIQQLPETE